MQAYLDLLRDIRANGVGKDDRTGTGTTSVFGRQLRFDLGQGFPVLTTKKIHLRSVIVELLWFLRGETNARWLRENGVTIWDEWADEAWRPRTRLRLPVAQLADPGRPPHRPDRPGDGTAAHAPAFAPHHGHGDEHRRLSRRGAIAGGQRASRQDGAAPCHAFFQFYVAAGKLSCSSLPASQDVFLGTPFNWASYALLTHMVAQQADLEPGDLVWTGGDCHLYRNHATQVEEQLAREPFPLPQLAIRRKPPSLFDYRFEDFEIRDYRCHPAIKAPIAV